jgi:hypothetical protein
LLGHCHFPRLLGKYQRSVGLPDHAEEATVTMGRLEREYLERRLLRHGRPCAHPQPYW